MIISRRTRWAGHIARMQETGFFFSMAQQPLVCQGLLIVEASRSHSDTPHSVWLLWTSDQPGRKDLYLTTHKTHKRRHPCTWGIQTRSPSKRTAAETCLRLRGRRDRQEIGNTWGTLEVHTFFAVGSSCSQVLCFFFSYWRLLSAALCCVGNTSLLYSRRLFQLHCQCCMCLRLMLTLCCRTGMFNTPSSKTHS